MARRCVIPAEPAHIEAIAADPRPMDALECWTTTRETVAEALATGLRRSTAAWTGLLDDEPVLMFGVAPFGLLSDAAAPWALASVAAERAPASLARGARPIVRDLATRYPRLVNYVHADNHQTIRWLRWVGFRLEPAAPYGLDGASFHRFTWAGETEHV